MTRTCDLSRNLRFLTCFCDRVGAATRRLYSCDFRVEPASRGAKTCDFREELLRFLKMALFVVFIAISVKIFCALRAKKKIDLGSYQVIKFSLFCKAGKDGWASNFAKILVIKTMSLLTPLKTDKKKSI